MACGIPCVAFDVGGVRDQIDNHINGCLASAGDTMALAEEIAWVLADDQRRKVIGDAARRKALDKFDINTIAARHVALYEHVLKRSPHVQSKN